MLFLNKEFCYDQKQLYQHPDYRIRLYAANFNRNALQSCRPKGNPNG